LTPSETGPAVELIEEPTDEQAAAIYSAARAEKGFAFALDAKSPRQTKKTKKLAAHELLAAGCLEAAERKPFRVGVCADLRQLLRIPLTLSCEPCLKMRRC